MTNIIEPPILRRFVMCMLPSRLSIAILLSYNIFDSTLYEFFQGNFTIDVALSMQFFCGI